MNLRKLPRKIITLFFVSFTLEHIIIIVDKKELKYLCHESHSGNRNARRGDSLKASSEEQPDVIWNAGKNWNKTIRQMIV